MKDFIVILTNESDESVGAVIENLKEIGENFYRFNTETFPLDTIIKVAISNDNPEGFLKSNSGDLLIEWGRVKSVWYRRPVSPLLPDETSQGIARFIKDETGMALWSLYTTLDTFWMNPPLVGQRLLQHNKLYQMKMASRIGLKVPDSVITNDSDALISFCRKHAGIIAVKLLKGNFFTKEGSMVPLLIFTQRISEEEIRKYSEDIKMAPLLAQEYIEKEIELRITIVGEKIFACAIHSQDSEQTKIDWRQYDLENVKHELYQLPKEIEIKLLLLMKKWGLSYGAIDMILTTKGDYVFLEINPNGQWLWIEEFTGMPISRTIAEILASPPNG